MQTKVYFPPEQKGVDIVESNAYLDVSEVADQVRRSVWTVEPTFVSASDMSLHFEAYSRSISRWHTGMIHSRYISPRYQQRNEK